MLYCPSATRASPILTHADASATPHARPYPVHRPQTGFTWF
ncbi:hypothetical protein HMPREF0742_02455 [Rothia aeria F0184]|uniref:Uncharacterized protein n=1 Tax=Rothia aeria F0184 TaxID=888019 RepID=U7UXM0_9MICC|nr:hypothetical protein HMPREF0742_02455 [Rothia aeria F0184]